MERRRRPAYRPPARHQHRAPDAARRASARRPPRDRRRRTRRAGVDAPVETVQVWIHEVPTGSWGAAGKLTAQK
ncbi:tautomerase family protein [Streptomyces sp. TLI_55]|uniref:tautomerase family protein n=1 Tax=Streptomyces sp. TLI_55 TaxID=1938861 RepID=UPI000D1A5864|nr:tautomerase family protein [Streptomyces sp. TLI_55]